MPTCQICTPVPSYSYGLSAEETRQIADIVIVTFGLIFVVCLFIIISAVALILALRR